MASKLERGKEGMAESESRKMDQMIRVPLKASSAFGAWFLSGCNCRANFLYCFLRSASVASWDTPSIS